MIKCNAHTPHGEFESNLVYDLESNNTSWNTSIIASFRIPNTKDTTKESNAVYPSEFSSFSYKPNFIKPAGEKENHDGWSQISDMVSSISHSSRKNKFFPKSTSVGHSLTYIKRLPSEIKLKLQNSECFVLKEIKQDQQDEKSIQYSHRVKSLSKISEIINNPNLLKKEQINTYRKPQGK